MQKSIAFHLPLYDIPQPSLCYLRLLRAHFHVTDTATSRNELYFYRRSDFQRLVSSKFEEMKKSQKIKKISTEFIKQLQKNFDFCPAVARCRLFNKSSLQATRHSP